MNSIFRHPQWFLFVLWFFSGIVFGVSFLHPALFWCFIPAFILFLSAVSRTDTGRHLFLGGVITGTTKASIVLSFFWHTYPLTWIAGQADFTAQIALIGILLIGSALGTGLLFGCGVYLLRHIKQYLKDWWLLLFPVMWVIFDILGAIGFSLVTLGPGSSVQANFTFGHVGYLLTEVPIFYGVGAFGGIYALSCVAASIGLFFYSLVGHVDSRMRYYILILCTCSVTAVGVTHYLFQHRDATNPEVSVVTVRTAFDHTFYLETKDAELIKNNSMRDALVAALSHNPDIVLFPEYARVLRAFSSQDEMFSFIHRHKQKDVIVVDHISNDTDSNKAYARALIFDTASDTVFSLDKQRLMQVGEYMPYIPEMIFRALLSESDFSRAKNRFIIYPGPLRSYDTFPERIPGILFCAESAAPFSVQQIVAAREMPLVLHPVGLGWFGESPLIKYQTRQMLKVQALKNNITIIQAANMSENITVTPRGEILPGTLLQSSLHFDIIRGL